MRFSEFVEAQGLNDLEFIVGYKDDVNIKILSSVFFSQIVQGLGTEGFIPKFTGSNTIDDSIVYQDGAAVIFNGTISRGYHVDVYGDSLNGIKVSAEAGFVALSVDGEEGEVFYILGDQNEPVRFNRPISAPYVIYDGGTSSQFVKADGSLDSNSYALESSIDGTLNYIAKFTPDGKSVGNSRLVDDADGVYNPTNLKSTFFGFRAGLNDDGSDNLNTAFGYEAMMDQSSAYANSAYGYWALKKLTTGILNDAFGAASMFENTTGSYNVAFGTNSLDASSTGSYNSAIGILSLTMSLTGNHNTALGFQSGFLSSTASYNTILGSRSFENNLAGSYNVAIGYLSGQAHSSIANSVLIGYNSRPAGNSQTNQLVVGYNAIGLGSNTTVIGNSSTTYGRWWGRLLVGTSIDSGDALRVAGTVRFDSVTNASGDFVTIDANNVLRRRTLSEVTGEITAGLDFVPYTGATQDVDLGSHRLTLDSVIFNNPGLSAVPGQLTWNADRYTLDLGMGLGGSVQQIGMETYYTPVKNQTGALIPDGTFVMATGSLGASGRMTVAPAITDGSVDSRYMLGVTTHDIANGADGLVTWFGEIRGFNTNTKAPVGETWIDGTVLWNNPAVPGGFTSVEPQAPNLKIPVAIVVSAGNNGVIFVRPRLGLRLTDLHDVNAFTPNHNDIIVYNSVKWESKSLGDLIGGTANQIVNGDGNLISNGFGLSFDPSGNIRFGSTGSDDVYTFLDFSKIGQNNAYNEFYMYAYDVSKYSVSQNFFYEKDLANNYWYVKNEFITKANSNVVASSYTGSTLYQRTGSANPTAGGSFSTARIGVDRWNSSTYGALQIDFNTDLSATPSIGYHGAVMTDSIYNRGIYYAGDYEANFIDRSLVTKQYVDAKVSESADKNFVYNQPTPSSTWNVSHGLNKFPSVSVVDSGGSQVEGDVQYIDLNNLIVTFSASFSGKAYIN